eukprot:51488-Chlamydomonas_euryale.AAC.1
MSSGGVSGAALLSSWPVSAGPMESAFGRLLEHLSREGVGDGPHAPQLRACALVPVAGGTRLAVPRRVFARVPCGELSPFVHELPAALAQHLPLLRSLGAADAPGAADLLAALSDAADAAHGKPLNANECASAVRLL